MIGVLLFILDFKGLGKGLFVVPDLFIGRAHDGVIRQGRAARHIADAAYVVHFRRRLSFGQGVGNLGNGPLSHAVA